MISSDRKTNGLIVCILFLRDLPTFPCVHVFDLLARRRFQRSQTEVHPTKRFYFIFRSWYRNDYYNAAALKSRCFERLYVFSKPKYCRVSSTSDLALNFSHIFHNIRNFYKNYIRLEQHNVVDAGYFFHFQNMKIGLFLK